jgi:SAM-dependent methyltransferase
MREKLAGISQGHDPQDDDSATEAKLKTAASFGYEWQRFHQLRDEWERNFLEYMQPHGPDFFPGKRVLDAGCGTGRHAYYAAKFGADVLAVDLSDAIDVAQANTAATGRVTTVQADLYSLPLEPESFDFIYSIGVLHHLPDPEGAFQNLLRYLKPGGEIQIYLYWWPEGRPIKRALLSAVHALRTVTTRLPHGLLYWLSYPLAATAFAGFVLPYRALRRLRMTREIAEQFPMKQYSDYPFQVCVNDQFDRFSAPIENRYTKAEVAGWLQRAGLESCSVVPSWGWVATGRKPLLSGSTSSDPEPIGCTAST